MMQPHVGCTTLAGIVATAWDWIILTSISAELDLAEGRARAIRGSTE